MLGRRVPICILYLYILSNGRANISNDACTIEVFGLGGWILSEKPFNRRKGIRYGVI